MLIKYYKIQREVIGDEKGKKVYGGYYVTDGVWRSRVYNTRIEARAKLKSACWGEGQNTI